MSEHQVSLARALAYGQGAGLFWIPVWPEVAYVGPVTDVATSIAVDTTLGDYRQGSSALIWESDTKSVRVTITSLTAGQINFAATGIAFTAAYVCPLRYGRCPAGVTLKRGPNKLTEVYAEFRVDDNVDLGASAGFPTLGGVDVLTDTTYYLGDYQESIIQQIEVFDSETGKVSQTPLYDIVDQLFNLSMTARGKSDLMRIRKWLHLRKGKLKPFWLINQANDLTLVANVTAVATTIQVTSINYQTYYTTSAIRILRKNGVATYHSVTSGTTSGGTDTLVLSAAAGTAANIVDVASISFMRKVCLETDRVELRHEENGYTTVKAPVREVVN
ncbi:MAG: hypothetical protein IPJ55_16890 [Chloracidobacterium sp.]|nr:hypothetical protein [Chloracidobacterium sp.]